MIWAGLSGDGVIWLLADKIMSAPESKARSAGVSAFAESTYLTAQIASPRGRVYMHTLGNDDAHAFANVIEKCVSISKMAPGVIILLTSSPEPQSPAYVCSQAAHVSSDTACIYSLPS